jgi:hypothetical protein
VLGMGLWMMPASVLPTELRLPLHTFTIAANIEPSKSIYWVQGTIGWPFQS